jgi:hypothetical protein
MSSLCDICQQQLLDQLLGRSQRCMQASCLLQHLQQGAAWV